VAERRERVAPLAERILGHAPAPLTRAGGELAQLVADAQRHYTGADVALVSPSCLRADVAAGAVTYEELFAAQAYDHPLLVLQVSGAELRRLVGAAGERAAISGLESPPRSDRSYRIVASELLLDHLPQPADRQAARAGTEVEALASYVETRLR
jgi:2',3'-cyclic-nucleotide 2'-phosphodiesterase (5'-nucleotidase family)